MRNSSSDSSGARLAVTGMALRNSLGNTPDDIWRNAAAMRSGLALVVPGPEDPPGLLAPDAASFIPGTNSYCDVIAFMDHSATRKDLGVAPHDFELMSASTRLTLLLARQAVEDAGLAEAGYAPERVGVFVSQNSGESASTLWGLNLTVHVDQLLRRMEEEAPLSPEQRERLRLRLLKGSIAPDEASLLCRLNCTAAGFICQRYGFAGPSYSLGAACSSSLAALYSALTLIRSGVIDAAVVGGSEEAYSPLPLVEFSALGALARRTPELPDPSQCSRPFDARRSGFILGEGAAMVVVERESSARARKARIHGFVSSCACTTNSYGPVEASADVQIHTMRASFEGLHYGPEAVDLIECHATGTIQGDREELAAVNALYGGERTGPAPVPAAFKSQVGHSLGASGLSALIRGLCAMQHGVFPGTLNFSAPDADLLPSLTGLRILSAPEAWPLPENGIRRMQVNAFGFGGSCVVVQVEDGNSPPPPARVLIPAEACADLQPSSESGQQERLVDGVSLISLSHKGQDWRLGSVNPSWPQELAGLSPEPGEEELLALRRRGIWLDKGDPPPLALVCCGQGSVYPGMGRELYDGFPAAREAMDRVAALADWDLLGLMDEKDPEVIIATRRQQPYLFLLEYAQFSYLQSLGLRPSVVCGHSLGELIALCLAGAYTPEGAWHILDGRSKVMSELENGSQHDTGMMSVHAGRDIVEECLREFPSLLVSNYNTPTQYVLSGPKTDLQAASRALRKRRIPAMQLKVSLAFHHPGMRVVRPFSLKGLRDVTMQGTRLPMLSNVTTELYPEDAEGIRNQILDLDENPVRWVECVDAMWTRYKARHFMELGPADVLCGLIGDIRPEALCIPAGRKGREAETLRTAVAALHALGHLPSARARHSQIRPAALSPAPAALQPSAPLAPSARPAAETAAPQSVPEHVEAIMPLLMQATGFSRHELEQDMDLRHDLSLRSSRFPLLMHEVEKHFGLSLRFEDLLGVVTIRDLANRIQLLREKMPAAPKEQSAPGASPEADQPPLLRCGLRLAPFTPPRGKPAAVRSALVAGRGAAAERAADILRSRFGTEAVTLCPDPRAALAAAEEQAFEMLLLLPDPAPSPLPENYDPCADLTAWFMPLKAFMGRREARFCLLASRGGQDDPVHEGCTGMLLAAALERQDVVFRSLLVPEDAALEDWLEPALVPDEHFGEHPLQWILRDGAWLSPQIVPAPLPVGAEAPGPLRPGDVIVVSGGGRGITPHSLRECAALGCAFILLGRGAEPDRDGEGAILRELEELGAQVEYTRCDVGDAQTVRRVLGEIHAARGRIDGIIHAAGVLRDAQIEALSPDAFAECLAPKCRGAGRLVETALPLGLRWVAAFSSIAALCGNPGQAAYGAANRAMCALLRALCKDRAAVRLFHLPPVQGPGMAQDAATREALRLRGMDKAFCTTAELARILARDLTLAGDEQIIPARVLPRIPTLLPFDAPRTPAEQTGLAPLPGDFLVVPEAVPADEQARLEGSRHFSQFRESLLAENRPRPGDAQPFVPISLLVGALLEGARLTLPWLAPVGAEELVFTPLPCPAGVTLEAEIRCAALPPRRGERLCAAELFAHDLTENGRKKTTSTLHASGKAALAPSLPAALASLWPEPAAGHCAVPPHSGEALAALCAVNKNSKEKYQLLTDIYSITPQQILARMRIPEDSDVVGRRNSGYVYPVHPLEALVQAAFFLALQEVGEERPVRFYPVHAALLRFSRSCAAGETLLLEARACGEKRRFCFDAEARDESGRVVLNVSALRFETE